MSYNWLEIIYVKYEYLKPYNCAKRNIIIK